MFGDRLTTVTLTFNLLSSACSYSVLSKSNNRMVFAMRANKSIYTAGLPLALAERRFDAASLARDQLSQPHPRRSCLLGYPLLTEKAFHAGIFFAKASDIEAAGPVKADGILICLRCERADGIAGCGVLQQQSAEP